MYCEYQSLYYGDDGYVVFCRQCNHYQIAFISTIITLSEKEFSQLYDIAKNKWTELDTSVAEHSKCVIIETPSSKIHLSFTKGELTKFYEILEEADNEHKAQALISLFNPTV